MKNIFCIVGTRPNIIKLAHLYKILVTHFNVTIVHTGQHKSFSMNSIFFKELNLPKPDFFLDMNTHLLPAGSIQNSLYKHFNLKKINNIIDTLLHCNNLGQISDIKNKLKPILQNNNPELVIVFGDVTSTLASALTAFYLKIPIAHIESGLRSFDLTMPEEINRIIVDHISQYYFTTEQSGIDNLIREGHSKHIYLVGNTMIDTLKNNMSNILNIKDSIYNNYIILTLHRPSNVDNINKLVGIMNNLKNLSRRYTIIFPIHPRTKSNIKLEEHKYIQFIDPLGYFEFIKLVMHSKFVITDSGGIQEETTSLNIKCFTLRKNTERPITLVENGGTNTLINNINEIEEKMLIKTNLNKYKLIQNLWNGKSSEKIVNIIKKIL